MPLQDLPELLADERFLNYCFERSAEDVRYWQERLHRHPEEQAAAGHAKMLALLLADEARVAETASQYQLLLARRQAPQPVAAPLGLWLRVRQARRTVAGGVAALMVAGAGLGAYLYSARQPVATAVTQPQPDVAPGGNSAILTLANGQRIDLGRAAQGTLAAQNGLTITKTADGQLVYKLTTAAALAGARPQLNTVETPAKGQFNLVLPDGTRVWLNAQSALSYPTAFSGASRQVTLRGEAYFEVAHRLVAGTQRRQAFVVETDFAPADPRHQRIEVLGTHFDVASYANEPQASTTLLEGSVRVATLGAAGQVLRPGQQLSAGPRGVQVGEADTDAVVAWKNGDFVFHEDLQTALRKVARWYDVEVVYDADAPMQLQLGGWISRQKNLSQVLHLLESTGKVHFKLEGRRVLVSK
jgi:ferric-dicitrate binding protein FerR (iron transport regulator)